MNDTVPKIKELLKKLLFFTFVMALICHVGFFRSGGINIEQLVPFGMESILIISGPMPSIIVAYSFPQPFTYGCMVISIVLALILLALTIKWFRSEEPSRKLNSAIPFVWCIIGFLNTFMLIGTGV